MPAPQRVHGEIPELVPCSCLGTEEEKRGQENHHQACRGLRRKRSHPKSSSHYVFSLCQNPAQPWGTKPPWSCSRHRIHPVLRTNVQLWHALKSSTCYKKATARWVSALEETCQGFFCAERARNLSEDEAELQRPNYTRVLNQPKNTQQESAPKRENRDQRNIRARGHHPMGTQHLETQPGHQNPILQRAQTHVASSPPAPAAPGAVHGVNPKLLGLGKATKRSGGAG